MATATEPTTGGDAAFTTLDGRRWPVRITFGTTRRLRAECGLKVHDLTRDGMAPLGELLSDLERFVDVLYATVRAQAEREGVTPEAFAEQLGGDAIEQATDAWVRALADFSPSQSRPVLTALATKEKAVRAAAAEAAARAIEAVDPAGLLAALTSTASAGGSPASAASTPTPAPSGSSSGPPTPASTPSGAGPTP